MNQMGEPADKEKFGGSQHTALGVISTVISVGSHW